MNRVYELTVVFSPQLNEKDLTAATEAVVGVVEKAGGTLGKMEDWGKKQFVYLIKRETEGVFRFWSVEIGGDKIGEVDKGLRLREGVLRFLLVALGKKPKKGKEKGGKHGNKVAK